MERNGAEDERPGLRIGGYVPGHAEPVAGSEFQPEPGDRPANMPNIADYWPDDGSGRTLFADTPPDFEAPRSRRGRPAAVLVGLLAGVIAVGTLLLMRPKGDEEPVGTAAPAAPATSAALSPSPSTASSSSASAAPSPSRPVGAESTTTPPPAVVTAAKFDLVTGVKDLNLRTAELDGENFRVTTPKGSGLTVDASFTEDTLKVSAKPDGTKKGSGRVDVVLDRDIVWRLRMTAGVETGVFDMGSGTVGDIDLIGGAQSIDIRLGDLEGTLPILMAGGVNKWRITTSGEVPVQIEFTSGAGEVNLYGQDKGGIGEGLTVKTGDWEKRPGLDIDAEAGLGSLRVSEK